MVSHSDSIPFRTADGLSLATEVAGEQGAPTLLFAHGLGQTRGAWAGAARGLAGCGYRCVTFDSRGHGQSDAVPGGDYHIDQFVSDLSGLARAQPEPPVLIGASMGGLLALVVAGEHKAPPFRALVLVDITPRWESAGVERILAFMQAYPDGFDDLEDAARRVAEYLPHRRGRKGETQLRPLLREGDDGRLRWHWDPALLAAVAGESERYQPRLLAAAARVRVPVLLLSGARSDVVSHQTVAEFLRLVPHAVHVEVAGATHMLAGDANDAFTREIARFIHALPAGAAHRGGVPPSSVRGDLRCLSS